MVYSINICFKDQIFPRTFFKFVKVSGKYDLKPEKNCSNAKEKIMPESVTKF